MANPRRTFFLLVLIYFLIALAFSLYVDLRKPFPVWNVITVSRAVGYAASSYLISAILPVILWAFGRFRWRNVGAPLIVWGLLMAVLIGMQEISVRYDLEHQINKSSSAAPLDWLAPPVKNVLGTNPSPLKQLHQ